MNLLTPSQSPQNYHSMQWNSESWWRKKRQTSKWFSADEYTFFFAASANVNISWWSWRAAIMHYEIARDMIAQSSSLKWVIKWVRFGNNNFFNNCDLEIQRSDVQTKLCATFDIKLQLTFDPIWYCTILEL